MNAVGADLLPGQARDFFHWDPPRVGPKLSTVRAEAVRSPQDLPPYLILGVRDDASFHADADGWSIRWQGAEPDTWLQWRYDRSAHRNEFTHSYCGEPGGVAHAPADKPVEPAIGSLYRQMLANWAHALRDRYAGPRGVYYVDLLPRIDPLVYFPDGRFLRLLLPLAPSAVQAWCERWCRAAQAVALPFPHTASIARLRCEIVYDEARHASTPESRAELAARCERQTGAPALALPARSALPDGRPGWRYDRAPLYAVVTAPFAGFSGLLPLLEDAGCLHRDPQHPLGADLPDGVLTVLIPLELTLVAQARLNFTREDLDAHLVLHPALGTAGRLSP